MSDPAHDQNDEQQPFPAWEDHTDLPVGEILRRTRAYYRLSLADVERGLRILPALDQTGESRGQSSAPRPPREEADGAPKPAHGKPGFHQRKFGGEKPGPGKFGEKKFGPGKFKNKKKAGRPAHKH